jgi:hypothetical protein
MSVPWVRFCVEPLSGRDLAYAQFLPLVYAPLGN